MIKILWIAPNLNHYKIKFINRLTETGCFEITVLAGQNIPEMGYPSNEDKILFSRVTIRSKKGNFSIYPSVYTRIYRLISRGKFDFVLMPLEKKFISIILFIFLLKKLFGFKLISYNHPVARESMLGKFGDAWTTKWLFGIYDRIIFYTRESMQWAVSQELIPKEKAFFANNTLDTRMIWQFYNFEINKSARKVILFIGRLVPDKRLDILLKYFEELKKSLKGVRLIIIGDGPEAFRAKDAIKMDNSISWQGALVNEAEISRLMNSAHLVFVPGASGLSIVHAFCYGKPYVTISGRHGPELAYLKDGENGLILCGDITRDCKRIACFLQDIKAYQNACYFAFNKARDLSVENWCSQMITAMSF